MPADPVQWIILEHFSCSASLPGADLKFRKGVNCAPMLATGNPRTNLEFVDDIMSFFHQYDDIAYFSSKLNEFIN